MCIIINNTNSDATLDYLEDTVAKWTQQAAANYNRIPVDNICEQFGVSNSVDFSNWYDYTLDLILSDVAEHNAAVKLPPMQGFLQHFWRFGDFGKSFVINIIWKKGHWC